MKSINRVAVGAALVALAVAGHAQAGTIQIVGRVVEDTCVIASMADGQPGGEDVRLTLADIQPQALAAAGGRGSAVPFELVVGSSARPCRQNRVRARLITHTDITATGRLRNRGTAQNVEIGLADAQGREVDLRDDHLEQVVALGQEGVGRLRWQARYHAVGQARPGSVSTGLMYLIDYP